MTSDPISRAHAAYERRQGLIRLMQRVIASREYRVSAQSVLKQSVSKLAIASKGLADG